MSKHPQQNIDLNAAMSNLPTNGPVGPTSQIEQDILRTTINADGSQSHQSFQRSMEGSTADKSTGSQVLTSIRDALGNRQHVSEATPDSIVNVDGVGEMRLQQAIAAGFVFKNAAGGYSAGKDEAVKKTTNDDAVTHPDLQTTALPSAADEAIMSELESGTAISDQVAVIEDLTSGREIDGHTLSRAASSLGTDPEQLQSKIDTVVASMEQQAAQSLGDIGVDAADVWQWAHENQPREIKRAMADHARLRNPRGYKAIGQAYLAQLDQSDPEALLSAELGNGIARVHRDSSGKVIITTKAGRTISWAAAVRAGLVKLSKAKTKVVNPFDAPGMTRQ